MATYELTAKLQDLGTSHFTFTAPNDFTATLEAVGEILDRAMHSTLWAQGEIRLVNHLTGELVQTMPRKDS